jgi:hypothetical protein
MSASELSPSLLILRGALSYDKNKQPPEGSCLSLLFVFDGMLSAVNAYV